MSEITVRLTDLAAMHPRLLWEEIAAATNLVLAENGNPPPFYFPLEIQSVPGCDTDDLQLLIHPGSMPVKTLDRIRRTFEPARLVELAAIAIAGFGLYCAGGHEIRDVALRGSGADYLVGDDLCCLEIAGRSKRKDFASAWKAKTRRLKSLSIRDFFICVVEFQTPKGRLAFFEK